MFFHRAAQPRLTAEGRLKGLSSWGFETERSGQDEAWARRGGFKALIRNLAGERPVIAKAGMMMGGELAELVDRGYIKTWETQSGKTRVAVARDLKVFHEFLEDLREALGLPSLYNESLGTVCSQHRYDRLKGRGGQAA